MKYRKLGRTGIEISEISLGTWAFGNKVYGGVDEQDGINTIHAGIDMGINIFDTAPQYGTPEQDGVAEIVLGKALKGKRDKVHISTKFGRNPTIKNGASQFYKSRIVDSVEESLKRLQTDYIDVLFFHSPFSPEEINDDVWEGIEHVKKQGKVRFIGHSISMFHQTENMARQWAKESKIDVIQVVLSLMNKEAQQLIEELQTYPIGVFGRECLANGFLSGAITKDTRFAEGTLNARYSREDIAERVDQVEAFKFLLRDDVKNMPQAALRWVLDQKGISTVLSGAKNISELKGAVSASEAKPFTETELKLAKDVLKKDFEPA
ncbi:aldo/keto reductase [Winogradskyella sediminis]|uniref:aldo/keto reductase n=1 Tax=Winogradskyella sediminis TaxID=1382466 RepID=UPI000E27BB10|nr:aldo/keto reductase [Winogradskyella sediminis]REG89437.1 aryl-alcohol dehydrogenase-like predicted oxidoreductase [Winogradskyella sediminis]